jgi:hypothetical protein
MNPTSKPSRRHAANEWLDYLRHSEGLGGILAKTEDLVKLKLALGDTLKDLDLAPLTSKIEVGWRSGAQNELFLLVSNASIASRLQQILPSIIKGLANKGVYCTAIKIRSKPTATTWEILARPKQTMITKPRGFNSVARASWQNLADRLEPDSELRRAVERLLQNKIK